MSLVTFTYDQLCEYFTSINRIVCAVYSICCIRTRSLISVIPHCFDHVLKPVVTSGGGNCMFNALSAVLRSCVYGLVKNKV